MPKVKSNMKRKKNKSRAKNRQKVEKQGIVKSDIPMNTNGRQKTINLQSFTPDPLECIHKSSARQERLDKEDCQAELQKKEMEIKQLHAEMHQMIKENYQLKNSVHDQNNQMDQLKFQIEELKVESDPHLVIISELKEKLFHLETKLEQQTSESISQLRSLMEKEKTNKKKLAKLRATLEQKEVEIDAYKQNIKKLSDENTIMAKKVRAMFLIAMTESEAISLNT